MTMKLIASIIKKITGALMVIGDFIKRGRYAFLRAGIAAIPVSLIVINAYINISTAGLIIDEHDNIIEQEQNVVIVPGAHVYANGNLSDILADRMINALELYRKGKVCCFLLSGDHGGKYYDEVNAMKNFLLKRGVPQNAIFLDHAGFNTYNTMLRAAEIFQVKKAVVSTQRYHLPRALYLANAKGIKAYGSPADRHRYIDIVKYRLREIPANVKAFFNVLLNTKADYMGEVIPITGDSLKSWDKPKELAK